MEEEGGAPRRQRRAPSPGVRSGTLVGGRGTGLSLPGLVRGRSQAPMVRPQIPPFRPVAQELSRDGNGWGPLPVQQTCLQLFSAPPNSEADPPPTPPPRPQTCRACQALPGPDCAHWQHPSTAEGRQQWGQLAGGPVCRRGVSSRASEPVRSCWVQPSEQGGSCLFSHLPAQHSAPTARF